MTSASTKTETCRNCQGRNYLLSNVKGKVRGDFCQCFDCKKCGGSGRIYSENEKGISSVQICDCARLENRLKQIAEANIPGKYVGTWLDSFHPQDGSQKKAFRIAKDFLQDFGKTNYGLVFMGNPGVGKTHLAVSIIKELILDKGVECKFVDFFQLLSDIRHGYSEDRSEQAFINPYIKSHVLVIDELAKGRNTEWEQTVLDQIISLRYNDADKVTIFTTNYLNEIPENKTNKSKKGSNDNLMDTGMGNYQKGLLGQETLQEKIGLRIYSRLVEICRFVKIDGEDFRQELRSKG